MKRTLMMKAHFSHFPLLLYWPASQSSMAQTSEVTRPNGQVLHSCEYPSSPSVDVPGGQAVHENSPYDGVQVPAWHILQEEAVAPSARFLLEEERGSLDKLALTTVTISQAAAKKRSKNEG